MRRYLVFAFLLLATGAGSQIPPPRKGETSQKPPEESKNDQAKAQHPATAITLTQVDSPIKQKESKQRKEQTLAETPTDWWGRGFGLLGIVFGTVQSYFIWRTLHLTKQSADAATKSAEVAEKALSDSERPWLTFPEPQYVPMKFGARVEYARLLVPAMNSGKSPAFLLSFQARTYVGEAPPHDAITYRELFRHRMRGVLVPGESRSLPPIGTILDAENGKRGFFVVVAVRYRDTLGRKHRSICVWEYVAWSDPPGFDRLLMSNCEQYT